MPDLPVSSLYRVLVTKMHLPLAILLVAVVIAPAVDVADEVEEARDVVALQDQRSQGRHAKKRPNPLTTLAAF